MTLESIQKDGRWFIVTDEKQPRYFHCSYPNEETAGRVLTNLRKSFGTEGNDDKMALEVNFSYPYETVRDVLQYEWI